MKKKDYLTLSRQMSQSTFQCATCPQFGTCAVNSQHIGYFIAYYLSLSHLKQASRGGYSVALFFGRDQGCCQEPVSLYYEKSFY